MIPHFKLSQTPVLLGKNKSIRSRRLCQEWQLVDPQPLSEISQNLVGVLSSLNRQQRRILNCLLYWSATTGKIYIRQDTLARYAGYKSRTYVNELLGKFIAMGLIASNYRHKTSCEYKVSSVFEDFQLRSKLKHLFSALAYFSISLLNGPFEEKPTQYISNYIYNIESNSNLVDQRETKHVRERVYVRENDSNEKKERTVMIKQVVEDIQNPKLTHNDKVQLSTYSDDAIRHGLIQLQRQRDLRNPIGFLVTCAKSFDAKRISKEEIRYETKKEQQVFKRDEPIFKTDSKEIRDQRRKNKLVYLAQTRGESEEYLNFIRNDTRPIIELENLEWERVKFLKNEEAKKDNQPLPFKVGTVRTVPHGFQSVTKPHDVRYTEPTDVVKDVSQRSIGDLIKERFNID